MTDPYRVKMMPGQDPYTPAELEQLYALVADAAEGDPGEQGEIEMRHGYGDAGHPFDPDRYGRCRWAGSGYCDGTRGDSQHERRTPKRVDTPG